MRLVLVGWGAINTAVAPLLEAVDVDIVAVGVRDVATPRPDLPPNATLITEPSELATLRPDVVAEAASRDSVAPWGRAALTAGADFLVSSVSAFAEAALLAELRALAESNAAQIQIHPGALGGIDALGGARLMGIDHVEHRVIKPPRAWKDTPAESLCALESIDSPEVFFSADAATTAATFPKNANVAMTTALAGIGPDATTITLIADPAATTNRHEVTASGAFGALEVSISNNPLPSNPKTSAMAALNLARAIRNRVSAIAI